MLGQKIALELFETEATKIANSTIPTDWLLNLGSCVPHHLR